jgi:GDP-mannose 6-dehydrogenase
LVGLSFKAGTDDLRESPLVTLAEHLIGKGLQLLVYDPEVQLSRLLGANRRFIESHLPHIGSLLCEDLQTVIEESDYLVLGMNDAPTVRLLTERVRVDQVVLDLVNIGRRNGLRGRYVGLCW